MSTHSNKFPCVFATGLLVYDHILFLDSYPALNEKRTTTDAIRFFGGPASNALAFLARSGIETFLTAAVGDDITGETLIREVSGQGVNSHFIQIKAGTCSPVAYILVEKSSHGKRTAILAHDETCFPDYNEDFIKAMNPGDILLVEGRYIPAEYQMCRKAHEKGVITVIDPGTRSLNLEQWIPVIDYWLAPKEGVVKTLGNIDLFSACQFLAKPPVKMSAITLGAGGVVYGNRESTAFQPAFPVKAVDSNGCGDIFHAGFIWGLLNGWSIPACVEFGAAAGAYAASFIGTHDSELNAKTVIKKYPFKHQ